MVELFISDHQTIIISDQLHAPKIVATANFWGDVYTSLVQYFPGTTPAAVASNAFKRIKDQLNGSSKDTSPTILGCRVTNASLLQLIDYIENNMKYDRGKDIQFISPDLRKLEDFHISYRQKSKYLPDSIDAEAGFHFTRLQTITQILIAFLYFYAYNEYKLVQCQHCGKWFATKTLKKKYCDRVSPCFGTIVKGKTPLSCEQAVRNILQKCNRIKNRIETKSSQTVAAQLHESIFQEKFRKECDHLYLLAKYDPTAENLTNYHNYLEVTEKERGWINNG